LELTEKYSQALSVYANVEQLDALIPNLEKNIAAAQKAQEKQTIRKLLGQGFRYLEQKDFDKARERFNKTLQTDPANEIASAGLEQVSQRHDVAIILGNEQVAQNYLADEQWSEAITAYEAILDLDDNIQLAKNGKQLALSHARAEKVLTRISAEPSKLSNANLFAQANDLLGEAKTLKYRGARLNTLIDSVSETLALYRDPVLVTLLSDNFTEIVLSNIGRLGTFQSKVLSLRSGEYTIRGSASGCRDIFLTVTVLPGIAPIEVLCMRTIR
jgi:tetratricopeptide (TPR) repeat protein